MDMNRRNVLIGLGTAAAGSSMAFGSGAFTQVNADRSVNLRIDNDSDALVSLSPNEDEGIVSEESGVLDIDSEKLASGGEGFPAGATIEFGDADFDDGSVTTPAFTISNNLASGADTSDIDVTVEVDADSDFDGALTLALDDGDTTEETISISDGSSDNTGDDFEGLTADGGDGGTIDVAIELDTDETDNPDDLDDETITVTAERSEE